MKIALKPIDLFSNDNLDRRGEYTVSEISGLIKKTVEEGFAGVRIRGEISGFKLAPSGHAYFSLKDSDAVLSAVCWKYVLATFKIKPEDGIEVICTGNVTIYPGQSKYQLVVTKIELAGVGALMALLEQRKKQFLSEGLFDEKHKQKIPFLPQRIGVITSPTGAVIRDILHRITDRFPVQIYLWGVLVQGDKSAEQVTAAINGFNDWEEKVDLIIIARGGGSIEDLWSFNEENVIRAAFASKIPIISAIGHETDYTLLDLVADLRAPTPTAAAEMAVPVRADLIATILDYKKRKALALQKHFEAKRERLQMLFRAIPNIASFIENKVQKLDHSTIKLSSLIQRLIDHKKINISSLAAKIIKPSQLISEKDNKLKLTINKLSNFYDTYFTKLSHHFALIATKLEIYDYKNVLSKGYAIVRDEQGSLITDSSKVTPVMEIEFFDNKVKVKK